MNGKSFDVQSTAFYSVVGSKANAVTMYVESVFASVNGGFLGRVDVSSALCTKAQYKSNHDV